MRGRPPKSEIREKITAILEKLGCSYGYEIYKHYKEIFNDATSRVVYYHLKKGVETGEFINIDVREVDGIYSWGDKSERVYYTLGPFAETRDKWSSKVRIETQKREIEYNWEKEVNRKINHIKNLISQNYNKQQILKKIDKLLEWASKLNINKELISKINELKKTL